MVSSTVNAFDTQHEDMIHDAQLDYYGKKLATCSSDRCIRIFDVDGENHRHVETLTGHAGPVWQVAWAHPKFGNILASCSYDCKVIIWREVGGRFQNIKEYAGHSSSVNAVAWAPHEYGLILACASSDDNISILTWKEDNTWDVQSFKAHSYGCNAVSWAPATVPGSLVQTSGASTGALNTKRFASGGCDNLVKIWREENGAWKQEEVLEGHTDWVRDVAWAPNTGLPSSDLASCSQDKTVLIWSHQGGNSMWTKKSLKKDNFSDAVWRVSWSTSGNILAVSSGDNKVTLWKEGLESEYQQIGDRWKFRKPGVHVYLKQDVEGLGEAGEIVIADTLKVRNLLVPFGLAYYVPRHKFKALLPQGWEPKTSGEEFTEQIVPAVQFESDVIDDVTPDSSSFGFERPTVTISMPNLALMQKVKEVRFQRMRVSEDSDRIFGSVAADNVIEAIFKQIGVIIEKSSLQMERIKTLGKTTVEINFGPSIEPLKIDVIVEEEGK
ncbi:GTPase-activating protein S13 [Nowakowskiella sp. JEL0407]|nr:GTPase-activating protein S13 [Nowakowskiella sp. JEL0407]